MSRADVTGEACEVSDLWGGFRSGSCLPTQAASQTQRNSPRFRPSMLAVICSDHQGQLEEDIKVLVVHHEPACIMCAAAH